MVNFVKKRLQVFVSSTYTDLIEERQAAVEAILNAGHIPAGMELFAAGDESQMEVIKQWIDESDVFLLILGGRYGSIEPKSGKSYVHLEYEYALSKGIALFSCVLKDADARATQLGDIAKYIERENPRQYKEFSELVQSEKIVKYWSDAKDIKLSIMQTLQNFSRRDNLIGWVRGDQQVNLAEITTEMTRLSEENGKLREQLSQSKVETFAGLSYEEMKDLLRTTKVTDSIFIRLADNEIKNLLDYFWQLRMRFYELFSFDDGDYVEEYRYAKDILGINRSEVNDLLEEDKTLFNNLGFRGLLQIEEKEKQYSSSPRRDIINIYRLSDSGLRFLNKLELEKSREIQKKK